MARMAGRESRAPQAVIGTLHLEEPPNTAPAYTNPPWAGLEFPKDFLARLDRGDGW